MNLLIAVVCEWTNMRICIIFQSNLCSKCYPVSKLIGVAYLQFCRDIKIHDFPKTKVTAKKGEKQKKGFERKKMENNSHGPNQIR